MRKTTLWWVLGLAVLITFGLNVEAQDHAFVGAAKCKMCHKVQYTSWQETTHAKALEHAKASTERAFGAECLACHATNSDENFPGVQCEACHGAGGDYKKMSIMKDREKAVANGLLIANQATCDKCHIGDDHASKKVYADEKDNVKAIHAHKE